MRIGLLYPAADPLSPSNWSGTPAGLASGFTAIGHDVVPIGIRHGTPKRQLLAIASRMTGKRGVVAHRTAIRRNANTRTLARELRVAGALDMVVAMGTELYHFDGLRLNGLPTATYDDGTHQQIWRSSDSELRILNYPSNAVQKWIDIQAANSRAATVCCVSTSWAAKSFIEDYFVPADAVHVVGMGHRPRNTPQSLSRDWASPRFLFVGVDWTRKNGEAVLRAFRAVHEMIPSARLDVVGAHPDLDSPGVTGHGFLPREDPGAQRRLDRLFEMATAFVLPSRFDPSPIAYLEAASAGLPVVATTEGGAGELLRGGAITVSPDNEGALFRALLLLADPMVAKAMGAEAQTEAAAATWDHVARRIESALLKK